MSQFGAFPNQASRDLFVSAFQDMMDHLDQGVDVEDIESGYIGNYSSDLFEGQGHTAPIIADWLGMTPAPVTRIENACASSGSALREGIMAIASGMYDVVLVGGVEKMTGLPTEGVTDVLASAADNLYEVPAGLTFPGIYGALAKAHMDRYETNLDHLLKVGIKNHNNGALNPKAQFNTTIRSLMDRRIARAQQQGQTVPGWQDEMDFLNDPRANPWIAWPLRLFDCAPITDGAACLLLVASDIAGNFTDKPISVAGTGQATGRPLHDAEELMSLSAAKYASAQAYAMAGVGPEDVQVAEVHDCFTIAEIIATEDLGFFAPGEGSPRRGRGPHCPHRRPAYQHFRRSQVQGAPGGRVGRGPGHRGLPPTSGRGRPPAVAQPQPGSGLDPQRGRHRRHLRRQHPAAGLGSPVQPVRSRSKRYDHRSEQLRNQGVHRRIFLRVFERRPADGHPVQRLRQAVRRAAEHVPGLPRARRFLVRVQGSGNLGGLHLHLRGAPGNGCSGLRTGQPLLLRHRNPR